MRLRTIMAGAALLASALGTGHVPAATAAEDPLARPLWGPFQTGGVLPTSDTLRTTASQYKGVSFFLAGTNDNVGSLGSIFDELGDYRPSLWRFGRWRPDLAGYQEGGALGTIKRGLGYWLITKEASNVVYNGTASVVDSFFATLTKAPGGAPGWNQVGNPFPFNINLTNWRVVKEDREFTVGGAGIANLIETQMKVFNPATGLYNSSDVVRKGEAFWARVIDTDNTTAWTVWTADPSNGAAWPAIAFDSKGGLHVSNDDFVNNDAEYLIRRGTRWIVETAEGAATAVGSWTSIKVDSLDRPFMAYTSTNGDRVRFASRVSGAWVSEDVEVGGGSYSYVTLQLFHGVPRISYLKSGVGARYAQKSVLGWDLETADDRAVAYVWMAVDRTGAAHLSYAANGTNSPLRYARRTTPTNWTRETVDSIAGASSGFTSSIAVDQNNVPHIAFGAQNDLRYAKKVGAGWTLETPDATGSVGAGTAIEIAPNGEPRIAYNEAASMGVPTRVKFVSRIGTSWNSPQIVDDLVGSQFFLGLALDANGEPAIAVPASIAGVQLLHVAERTPGHVKLRMAPTAVPEPQPGPSFAKPAGTQWAVALQPRMNDRMAETVWLGVADDAAPGWDHLSSAVAPPPPDGFTVLAGVRRADWGALSGDYVWDFQPPAARLEWPVTVSAAGGPGEIALTVRTVDLPSGMGLWITDASEGWTRQVQDGDVVNLVANGRDRQLTLVAGVSGPTPRAPATELSYVYPNPFTERAGFAFRLGDVSRISVRIYDLQGRMVRDLQRSGVPAGEHVVVWDALDDAGRTVPNGVYLARYEAGGISGTRRLVKIQ